MHAYRYIPAGSVLSWRVGLGAGAPGAALAGLCGERRRLVFHATNGAAAMATFASKKLLNAEDDVVEQMVCGLLACHPTLTRLEGTCEYNRL